MRRKLFLSHSKRNVAAATISCLFSMSTGASSFAAAHESAGASAQQSMAGRLADYVQLSKPRITVLELITVIAAMRLAVAAGAGGWNGTIIASLLIGTTLLAASANALNQYLERRQDALMRRTAQRPLPAGRMQPMEAALFGIGSVAIGSTILAIGVNALTAGLGLLSWFVYVAIYTPMKKHSTFNTTVGAVSGALPILMGWTAGGGGLDLTAFGLFLVLLLWQYPHFMAIAWLCREDYSKAGYQMATTIDATGRRAGAQAITGAALLIPASLLPAIGVGATGGWYGLWVVLIGVGQLLVAISFARKRDDRRARRLMRASLLYLPAWMLVMSLLLP